MDMRRVLNARLLASVIVVGWAGGLASSAPAVAQMDQYDQGYYQDQAMPVSFDSFHDQLAPYGYWLYSDRWGVVWQPWDVTPDFRPYYTAGHWAYTDDYGWYWQSDYTWGDIPFHYGRWVNDPDDGWLWIPGYVWSPGWVVWRSNEQYIGWMPMPPDEAFLGGRGDFGIGGSIGGVSFRFGLGEVGGFYGYSRWYGPDYDENRFARNWIFVGAGHMADRDYRPYVVNNNMQVINIIHQTRNITNYTVVNNYVVNKSVDVHVVERAAGRPIPVVRAAMIVRHPNLVTRVDVGQRVQLRMRAAAPRGMGVANSAPPPPATVINKLSVNVRPVNGHAPVHLFTRAAVARPEVQSRFQGPPVHAVPESTIMRQRPPGAPASSGAGQPGVGGMTGPGGATMGGPGGTMGGPGMGTTEHPALHHETPPSGAPGGTMGGPGMGTTEHPTLRHETAPSAGPGGTMGGPGGTMGTTEGPGGAPATTVRHHEAPPTGGPGGTMGGPGGTMGTMEGPGGAPATTVRHHETPATAAPGGSMSAPGGSMGSPMGAPEEHHVIHHEPPASTGGGMMGPGSAPHPETVVHPHPAVVPHPAATPENPPKKKEHPNPDEQQPPH